MQGQRAKSAMSIVTLKKFITSSNNFAQADLVVIFFFELVDLRFQSLHVWMLIDVEVRRDMSRHVWSCRASIAFNLRL